MPGPGRSRFPSLRETLLQRQESPAHQLRGGVLEDPWNEPSEDMFVLSVSPEKAPDKPIYLEIAFDKGTPWP